MIREATVEDFKTDVIRGKLAMFGKAFFDELKMPGEFSAGCFLETMRVLMENNRGGAFFMFDGPVLIGCLGYISSFNFLTGEKLISEAFFYLDPEHRRGRGAYMLIKLFIEKGRLLGAGRALMAHMHTTEDASKVGDFYARLGFVPLETFYHFPIWQSQPVH